MLFHVSRNGQTYGPYTLEDLQRYVASGNVLPTDLAKSEEMSQWLPVSQILAGSSAAAPQDAPGAPAPAVPYGTSYPATAGLPPQAYPAAPGLYPDAPNLSWGLVLLFSIFTCSAFIYVWNIVVAAWMKRVRPQSNAVIFYAIAAVLLIVQMIASTQVHVEINHVWSYYYRHPLRDLIGLSLWIIRLIARFTLRSDLEEHFNTVEPVGLRLSGVMTFFFGGLYFQYHLNRINELKRMARYRGAAI